MLASLRSLTPDTLQSVTFVQGSFRSQLLEEVDDLLSDQSRFGGLQTVKLRALFGTIPDDAGAEVFPNLYRRGMVVVEHERA